MVTTIRVTRKLIETLSGNPTTSPRAEAEKAEPRQRISWKDSPDSQKYLEETVQYGNLLLKREGSELRKVDQFADDLLSREFQAPQKPLPCQEERLACLSCYKENMNDPAVCSGKVKRYHECSQSL